MLMSKRISFLAPQCHPAFPQAPLPKRKASVNTLGVVYKAPASELLGGKGLAYLFF